MSKDTEIRFGMVVLTKRGKKEVIINPGSDEANEGIIDTCGITSKRGGIRCALPGGILPSDISKVTDVTMNSDEIVAAIRRGGWIITSDEGIKNGEGIPPRRINLGKI